jgi:tripartite-type tricarboxylate transporter receptor subunit TctC
MPELPTMAESGLPGFAVDTWFGLFGPAGLSADMLQRLHSAFATALASSEVKAKFAPMMAEPAPMAPAAFGSFVKAELAKYEPVVKASGVTLD